MTDTLTGCANVIRYAGTALQLLGILITALSIRDVRRNVGRLFPRPRRDVRDVARAVAGKARHAWKRLTRQRRDAVVTVAVGTATGDSTAGKVEIRRGPTTIEERVADLEHRMREQEQRTDELQRALAREVTDRRNGDAAERHAREAADRKANERIDGLAHVTAGSGAVAGVVVFIAGVLAGGVPEKIAALLRC